MLPGHFLPGPFLLSDSAKVTRKSAAAPKEKKRVDNLPKCQLAPNFPVSKSWFPGLLILSIFGRHFARFPGERNKTYVILLRSLAL